MKLNFKFSVFIGLIILSFTLASFGKKKEKLKYVEVETTYGVMKFKLYNETPLHRDNFIKLANEEYFDSLLFHRVINQFMIQGGDPDSKGAPEGKMLGNGGPKYDIDAEFVNGLYHKKGALAAAREGDDVNPLKRSSGSQFYIVQGQIFDSVQLANMQSKRMEKIRKEEFKSYLNASENKALLKEYKKAIKSRDEVAGQKIIDSVDVMINPILESYAYTDEQIKTYTTVGGTPHLDYAYTVFGEMIEGFEVLDSIASVQTDRNNRPMKDVIMKIRVVKK
ncbi:MAG: peptidylprolyl isomerase [Salibacteraceae bacterium]